MTTYTLHDLLYTKGTSEPVRQMLFAMAEKIERLEARQWQGLTDEEIENLWGEPVDCMYSGHYNAIRDIEAKLKEKNG